MKKYLWLLSILPIILLSACSSSNDPQNNTSTKDYLPITSGSYWVYNQYTIDSLNQRANPSIPTLDSTIITGTESKLSKTATVFQNFINTNNTGYVKSSNWYFYKENSNISVFSGLINEMIGIDKLPVKLPFAVEDKWLLVLDNQNTKWNVYTKQITNDSVTYNDIKGVFTGTLKIDAEKIGSESITVGSKSITTQKIKYVITVTGNATISAFPIPLPVSLNGNFYFWFGEDVGLTKLLLESQTISVTGLAPQRLDGKEQVLLRYLIK
jgi:hypothetical protein